MAVTKNGGSRPRSARGGAARATPSRKAGRPYALTLDAVADAVIAVGFVDFTVGKVASELNVDYTTLYRYAPNRDGLALLGLDRLVRLDGMVLVGPTGDAKLGWRRLLERASERLWTFFRAHGSVAMELSRATYPPSLLAMAIELGAALMARGFAAENAAIAVDVAFEVAIQTQSGAEYLDLESARSSGRRKALTERMARATPATSDQRAVLAAFRRIAVGAPDALFARRLAVALAGIEQTLAPKKRATK